MEKNELKWVSEVINLDEKQNGGFINLIEAPCGSGKTHCAIEKICALASRPERAIYLIDTITGRDSIARDDRIMVYDDEWRGWIKDDMIVFQGGKIVVMTYAKFGSLAKTMRDNEAFWQKIEIVVCDELQNIYKYIGMNSNKTQEKPTACINDDVWREMEETQYNVLALDRIKKLCHERSCFVFALSATPDMIRKKIDVEINNMIPDTSILRHYVVKETIYYRNLDAALSKFQDGQKVLIYVALITQMLMHIEPLKQRGLKVMGLWSPKNDDHPMYSEQLTARQYIIDHECLPNNVDFLFINDSYETCININGRIDAIVIHSTRSETITQVRGRYRNNLDSLYLYTTDNETVCVPQEYLNVHLYKEDKKRLVEEMHLRDKSGRLCGWPTTKRAIEASGYTVKEIRRNNQHVHIIQKDTT